jgi:hypothetical protein
MACSKCEFGSSPHKRGLVRAGFRGLGWGISLVLQGITRLLYALGVGLVAGSQAMIRRQPTPLQVPLPLARPVPVQPIMKKDPPLRTTSMEKPQTKHGSGKRIVWILVIGMIAAGVVSMATSKSTRYVAPAPTPESLSRLSARKLQAIASDNAVVAAAQAGRNDLAERFGPNSPQFISTSAPEVLLESSNKPNIRLVKIRSDAPHLDQERAQNDALLVAQQRLSQLLRNMSPPIETLPSIDVIRTEYLKPNSFTVIQPTDEDRRLWQEKKLETNRVWVEIDALEVNAEQLRKLRASERMEVSAHWGAMILVFLAAFFGFLRLDAWTKGYLTMILGFGFAAIAGGAVALMFWMR